LGIIAKGLKCYRYYAKNDYLYRGGDIGAIARRREAGDLPLDVGRWHLGGWGVQYMWMENRTRWAFEEYTGLGAASFS
jgi:hypothetical protein